MDKVPRILRSPFHGSHVSLPHSILCNEPAYLMFAHYLIDAILQWTAPIFKVLRPICTLGLLCWLKSTHGVRVTVKMNANNLQQLQASRHHHSLLPPRALHRILVTAPQSPPQGLCLNLTHRQSTFFDPRIIVADLHMFMLFFHLLPDPGELRSTKHGPLYDPNCGSIWMSMIPSTLISRSKTMWSFALSLLERIWLFLPMWYHWWWYIGGISHSFRLWLYLGFLRLGIFLRSLVCYPGADPIKSIVPWPLMVVFGPGSFMKQLIMDTTFVFHPGSPP